jgi:uncharacterized repeat protein (TIGR03803 family)
MKRIGTVGSLVGWVLLVAGALATAQTVTVLHTYPIGSGATSGIAFPQVMSQGRDGELYGTIYNNGTKNEGTVFKITTGGTLTTLYSFCALTSCDDGINPLGGVTLGFDGDLYGTTQGGGGSGKAGTVFKLTPTGTLTTLHAFGNSTDDSVPAYTTLQGQDGNTYGVSIGQYNGQYGAFFKVSPSGAFKVLHDFTYTDGSYPNLPTQGTDGNFYGTAVFGGAKGFGVVYKITPAGKVTVLHNFTGYPSDGTYPKGILVQGKDGNFYGTTYQGGSNNNGSVFKITPTGVLTVIHSFVFKSPSFDGQLPWAGLTLGPDGNFYGTTGAGGTKNAGTLFKVSPSGAETVLHNFCDPTCNGFGPATPMVLHTNGKLYGNTNGNSLGGSVFYSLSLGFKPLVDLVTWSAKVGATVEILGQGFTGTKQVLFGTTPAVFQNVSDTYMTATVPAGATTGSVTVTTFTTSFKSNRSFLVTPQITSFTPSSGKVGTLITINGVSLTQTSNVTIGGKTAGFTIKSDTQVTATVPAGARTGQKITITTAGGVATSPSNFVVVPAITSFTPTSGPKGTSVSITGNSFTGTTGVTFGGVAATSFQVISDTQVDALVPNGAVTGAIAVTTPGGTATSSAKFTVTP